MSAPDLDALKTVLVDASGHPRLCKKCASLLVLGQNTSEAMLKSRKYSCLPCRNADPKDRARRARWREQNQEKQRSYEQKWRLEHPDDAKRHSAAYLKRNKAACAAREAGKRAETKQRTPAWADRAAILAIYRHCQSLNQIGLPLSYHVDHVIPLAGVTVEGWPVSGLHCEANLQVMRGDINVKKSNRYLPWLELGGSDL